MLILNGMISIENAVDTTLYNSGWNKKKQPHVKICRRIGNDVTRNPRRDAFWYEKSMENPQLIN